MSSDDAKNVQTKLSEDEYERFCELARERDPSFKDAEREAIIFVY